MMSTPLPPIYRDIRRLLVHTEEMVRRESGRVGTHLCPRGREAVAEIKPRGQTIQPSTHPTTATFLALRSLCHKLLANTHRVQEPLRGKVIALVRDPMAAALVPPHKRLANAAPGCGLPIGNLTSQFFANVYLNALLSPANLIGLNPLQLPLVRRRAKPTPTPTPPLTRGGREGFSSKEQVGGSNLEQDPLAHLQAMLGSYWGHFAHANSVRLRRALFDQFNQTGWLRHGTRRREVQEWFSPNAVVS